MRSGRDRRRGHEAKEDFGARLARLRQAASYSQRALAEEIGISHRMVAYYEGETARAPAHLLPKIARALAVTVDQLLGVAPVSPRKRPRNQRLMRELSKVERLSARNRRSVIEHIEGLLAKERLESMRANNNTGVEE